jgi:hypothetical protein
MELTRPENPQIKLSSWHHIAIFVFACITIVSRQPDALFHAQFWAEDGHVWFADAYNLGWWQSLFRVFEGYVEIFPRLGAALALLVPLRSAPLVLNVLAICVRAIPVSLLISSRSAIWGTLGHRALLAAIYLGLPNTGELNSTITNSQWFLAFSTFLILVAVKPRNRLERWFDFSILILCAFSGPFCIFLLPIAAFLVWRFRGRAYRIETAIIALGCIVQMWYLLGGGYSSRIHNSLGASLSSLVKLLASELYIGTLLGPNNLAANAGAGLIFVFSVLAISGLSFTIFCLLRSHRAHRLFFAFSALVLATALNAPLLGGTTNMGAWAAMTMGAGTRYWFFPCLWLAWSLLMSLKSGTRSIRGVSAVLLCILYLGMLLRWRITALPDTNFAENAAKFERAPVGTEMTIPVNPPGWNLRLIKHAGSQ